MKKSQKFANVSSIGRNRNKSDSFPPEDHLFEAIVEDPDMVRIFFDIVEIVIQIS